LLQWLEEEAQIEEKRREEKKTYHRKGYYGHLFNLCNFLKTASSTQPSISALVLDEKYVYAESILVEQEAISEEKMLGGLAKKQLKHNIMHDKEVLHSVFRAFSKHTPRSYPQRRLQSLKKTWKTP
jgi:hypothetical protein